MTTRSLRRVFEVFAVTILCALSVSFLIAAKNAPEPAKRLPPESQAQLADFFQELRTNAKQAPEALLKGIKNEHPYEIYQDLKSMKADLEELSRLYQEVVELDEEWNELNECSDQEAKTRLAAIEARRAEIVWQAEIVNERLENY